MKKSLAALVLMLGTSSLAQAAVVMPKGDAMAGQGTAAICAGCHGMDGNSATGQFPKLAGQNAKYIYKQLQDFKSGHRANPMMLGVAAGLSDQDMANVAVFMSQQKQVGGAAKPELVAMGERLFRGGNKEVGLAPCSGCHGPAGRGNTYAAFPRIGGQHADYIKAQLIAFRAAGRNDITDVKRTNDSSKPGEPGPMQMIAAKLSDHDIEALSSFIQGLR
ncbi:MAG: c-type cytochrome [Perlucidibaca sp.]